MPFQKNLVTRIDPKVYKPVGIMPTVKQYTIKPQAASQVTRDVQRPLESVHRSRPTVGKQLRANLKAQSRKKTASIEKDAGFVGTVFRMMYPKAAFYKDMAPFVWDGVKYVGGKAAKGLGNAAIGGVKAVGRGVKYTAQNPGKVLRGTGKAALYTAGAAGTGAAALAGYGLYKGMKHIVAPGVRMGWKGVKGATGLVTGTVGTAYDLGKAVVKAPFSLLSGANSVRKGLGSLSTMSQPAKAALGAGTAVTAYYANEYAQKYREQKAQEEAQAGMYAGLPTEDQYVGKMAAADNLLSNIPKDTSTPNSNNPEDYADMYDYQEYVNSEGHPDRDNLPNPIEKEPRKVASLLGMDIAVHSEINEYTGHPRIKVASMTYREKCAKSQGSKLLGASLVLGGTAIGVGQLNKREGEFKQWKPNYYAQ